jgi:hypothetical protein
MLDKLNNNIKGLKSAIERFNLYKSFVDLYKSTHSLENYINYIEENYLNMSEPMRDKYLLMIESYQFGDHVPLLNNLYDKLLSADEFKTKYANEVKVLLSST